MPRFSLRSAESDAEAFEQYFSRGLGTAYDRGSGSWGHQDADDGVYCGIPLADAGTVEEP